MIRYLTQRQAAEYVGLGLTAFRTHVQPRVPVYRQGGARRRPMFRAEDLDALMTEHASVPTDWARRRARARNVVKASPTATSLAQELGSYGT